MTANLGNIYSFMWIVFFGLGKEDCTVVTKANTCNWEVKKIVPTTQVHNTFNL